MLTILPHPLYLKISDREECDDVSPVSWKVDRKCHLVSAKSMDEMCRRVQESPGMKSLDTAPEGACSIVNGYGLDLEDGGCWPDTHPESAGTRRVVLPDLTANNLHFDNCD